MLYRIRKNEPLLERILHGSKYLFRNIQTLSNIYLPLEKYEDSYLLTFSNNSLEEGEELAKIYDGQICKFKQKSLSEI